MIATRDFWEEYLRALPATHAHHAVTPDAFAFGDSVELADELAALVVDGRKRATASIAVEFTSLNEPLPRPGDVSIILRGDGSPVAIIERTSVETVPFESVSEAFAAAEGEDDGTLRSWREAHADYFGRVCERMGGVFSASTPVICQVFRVVWLPRGA